MIDDHIIQSRIRQAMRVDIEGHDPEKWTAILLDPTDRFDSDTEKISYLISAVGHATSLAAIIVKIIADQAEMDHEELLNELLTTIDLVDIPKEEEP